MPALLAVEDEKMKTGEEGAPSSKRGKKGGGSGGDAEAAGKKLDSVRKNPEMKALMTLVLKTQLRGEQRMRELEGAMMMTFIGAGDALFLNNISCQTQSYQTKVKGQKNHGLGPPIPMHS